MAKHPSHILELARRGAEHRYHELKTEIATLLKHFPDLRERFSGGLVGEAVKRGRRKRKGMSAAARKAVSARMKKYWAAKRKAKQG